MSTQWGVEWKSVYCCIWPALIGLTSISKQWMPKIYTHTHTLIFSTKLTSEASWLFITFMHFIGVPCYVRWHSLPYLVSNFVSSDECTSSLAHNLLRKRTARYTANGERLGLHGLLHHQSNNDWYIFLTTC